MSGIRIKPRRIRSVNPERKKKLVAKQYGPFAEWVRRMRCPACLSEGVAQTTRTCAAHALHTKGAGGRDEDCLPLCFMHEVEVHSIGIDTFQARVGVDLEDLQRWLLKLWQFRTSERLEIPGLTGVFEFRVPAPKRRLP